MKAWVCLAIAALLLGGPLWAQEPEFVDAPPVLDNAPGGGAGPGAGGGGAPLGQAFVKDAYHQVSSGMVNYGYADHPYYQFTGDDDFAGGQSPTSFISNVTYLRLHPVGLMNYTGGWAWGLEWLGFQSSSEDVLAGAGEVTAPSVKMTLSIITVNGRVYFRDLASDRVQPFVGMGIGAANGEFSSTSTSGSKSRSTFLGLAHFRTFGTNVLIGPRAGLIVQMRQATIPDVETSNDPFGQGNGSSTSLDFSGTMLNFTGFYRF